MSSSPSRCLEQPLRRLGPLRSCATALALGTLLIVGAGGCGGSGASAARQTHLLGDRDDDDIQGGRVDPDEYRLRTFGHAATGSEREMIAALVRRYYAAAAADNGQAACSMLLRRVATSAHLGEMAEAVYPPPPDSPLLSGRTCPQIMSSMFAAGHQPLVKEKATLVVTEVRVGRSRTIVFLGFSDAPERLLTLAREGGRWKLEGLLDVHVL